MKRPVKGSIEYNFYGTEPSEYNLKAIHWYNYFAEPKDYTEWFTKYLKKHKLNVSVPDTVPNHLSLVAHFLDTNRTVPEKYINEFETFVKSLTPAKKEVKKRETNVKKPSVQDRINEQVRAYCAVIDGVIDDFIDNGYATDFDVDKFVFDIKPLQAGRVSNFYEKQLQDVLKNDEFSKEGYSFMTKEQKSLYISLLEKIVNSTKSKSELRTKRTPRKRKETPAYKKVQKLKYCNMYKDLNLVSINPQKIIGASVLIAYNTKTRQLIQFVAEQGGFDVKGTSLLNMDENRSKKYRLRKPDEVLKNLGGKVSIRNTIKNLTTKPLKTSSRINGDMVLIKVF